MNGEEKKKKRNINMYTVQSREPSNICYAIQ